MVWPAMAVLMCLAGAEPAAPQEHATTPPVPDAEPTAPEPTAPEPTAPPVVSPFEGPTPAPLPPRVDRADLFDPWSVPLQTVVPTPDPEPSPRPVPHHAIRLDPPLLDPWHGTPSSRGPLRLDPDLRHPFTSSLPAAAPRVARVDLRDPFAGPTAAEASTRAAVPSPRSPQSGGPEPEADLRDPFTAAPRLPAPRELESRPQPPVGPDEPGPSPTSRG
ncbi:MAG: hypothetical protein AB1Z98_02430 [Nannocystaceae bacterium]